MLPKDQRMPRELFRDLLLKSEFTNSSSFSMRYRITREAETRVGVSVSKKVSKSAVVRNTVRRRVYSEMRNFIPTLPKGLYLIVAKNGSENTKGEKLKLELKNLTRNLR